MSPKHDETPIDEVDEAIRQNIERGLMIEVSPGQYSLTEAGIEHTKAMLRDSKEARDLFDSFKKEPKP